MGKIVYIVNKFSAGIKGKLEEAGLEVIVGDGSYNDDLLKECFALVPGRCPVDDKVLDKAPNLKIVAKEGVGVDRYDVDAISKRGIYVCNTPGSNAVSVAEHTIALMFAAARNFYRMSANAREGIYGSGGLFATELEGKTVSIIGFGNIGRRVAKKADALGMNVCAYIRNPEGKDIPDYVKAISSMDEVIQAGDYVTLHVSGTEANRNLFGEREFSLMKPTAYFINTTRGFVVDEDALYNALAEERIAGAGVDVLAGEPDIAKSRLLSLNNIFITPHTGGNTKEARKRAAAMCASSIIAAAEGKVPQGAVNSEAVADR